MNAFAVFEDGHIENIDVWKIKPNDNGDPVDVWFFIGPQMYLYHEYIDDVCGDILSRSPDTVFFHRSHVFYKVDNWNDPIYSVDFLKGE